MNTLQPLVVNFPKDPRPDEWWRDAFICGDASAVMDAMPAESVHLAITSPPYNVGLDYDSHHDSMPYEKYLEWLMPFWKGLLRALVPGGRFALNIAPTSIKDFRPIHYDMARQLRDLGFIMRTEILWYKQTIRRRTAWGSFRSPSNPHILPSWEYVLVFSKGAWKLEGDTKESDITSEEFIRFSDGFWEIRPETRRRQAFTKSLYKSRTGNSPDRVADDAHPAAFPEELIYRLIKFYSYRNNVVLDPFGGTGTVAAVAHRAGRRFVHVDISKKYCEIARERILSVDASEPMLFAGMETPPKAPKQTSPTKPAPETRWLDAPRLTWKKRRGRPRKHPETARKV